MIDKLCLVRRELSKTNSINFSVENAFRKCSKSFSKLSKHSAVLCSDEIVDGSMKGSAGGGEAP